MIYRRALITGASSGIGRTTAERLGSLGVHLILVARRKARLDSLSADLRAKYGIEVVTAVCDVRNRQEIEKFVLAQRSVLSATDILINNAGLAKGNDKLFEGSLDDWDSMIDTNVKGLLYFTRAVLPFMIANKAGHVVNIGSVAGRWIYPGGAVYCATKFAVRALSEGLRMDLLGSPIRVTNIEPGMVESEFSEVRFSDKARAKIVYQGMTPLSEDDIAESIVWCLQRPAHVNIQEMVIYPTDQAAIQMVQRRESANPI